MGLLSPHLKLGKALELIFYLKIGLLSEKRAGDSKHFCLITINWAGPTPMIAPLPPGAWECTAGRCSGSWQKSL
jgi:hypothetical protein